MVQDKPKFKLSRQEMLEFNDACDEAASCCPQYRNDWGFEDRDILQGAIKPKQLVRHWLDSSVLFSSGYHRELSPDAQAVFKRYKLYKAARTIWKAQQEALGFTIECGGIMLVLSCYCCECLHGFSLLIDAKCRKTVCPFCKTVNDFWLDSEQPPENHR